MSSQQKYRLVQMLSLKLSSPLSALSLCSLSLPLFIKIICFSNRNIFTSFSLMLAPFRTRISSTSPFPCRAARCNGVWNQKHQKCICTPSLVNVNKPSVIKDITLCIIHPSIWKSSSSPNPFSSCHSHIQWSVPPKIAINQPNENRDGGEREKEREGEGEKRMKKERR